jgi:hypothetical protein
MIPSADSRHPQGNWISRASLDWDSARTADSLDLLRRGVPKLAPLSGSWPVASPEVAPCRRSRPLIPLSRRTRIGRDQRDPNPLAIPIAERWATGTRTRYVCFGHARSFSRPDGARPPDRRRNSGPVRITASGADPALSVHHVGVPDRPGHREAERNCDRSPGRAVPGRAGLRQAAPISATLEEVVLPPPGGLRYHPWLGQQTGSE